MAANTRADAGNFGQLPTFGDSAVPQSPDVNSYSDRQTARLAGEPGETQQRVFQGLSDKLGGMVDQAVAFEGKQAGLVAGTDPNYRPNADESIRGRAFTEAANQTYLNSVDAQSKQQASQAYSDWLQLPPGQRQPGALQKSFDGIQQDFNANHLFPEIQGQFQDRFADHTTALMQGAQRNYEEQVHNSAQASFMASDAANRDVIGQIASTGLNSNAGALQRAVAGGLANIDNGVAQGALRPQDGVTAKQEIVDNAYLADHAARYGATPPSERSAFRQTLNAQPAAPPAPVWPPQAAANWSDGINFAKAGPFSAQTSANDPLAPEVKGGLQALHNSFGPITVTSTTEGKHDPNGFHYQGKAVDVSIAGYDDAQKTQLIEDARQSGFTGFGIGATHLHLDMRPSPDGKPVVFPDAYAGPVAGKDVVGWQTHLNALGAPIAAGASVNGTPAVSFNAVQKLNTYLDGVDRQQESQTAQQEKGQLADIAAARKQVIGGNPIPDDQYAQMKRDYAGSPSPAVAQDWNAFDNAKSMIESFKGQRPEAILADIDNAQGTLAKTGASPAQVTLLKDMREYYGGLKTALATNALGRAASEGVVGQVAPLNPADPNLASAIKDRAVAAQHTSDFYHQPANFFLPGEGASFAQGLPAVARGLSSVADAPTLNAMAEDKAFKDGLVANARSGDPARMNAAYGAMGAISAASPMEFEGRFGKEAAANLSLWNRLVGQMPAPEAAQRMMALNDPAQATARQYRDEAANQQLKNVDDNAVVKMFAQHGAIVGAVTGDTKAPVTVPDVPQASSAALRADYASAYKDYYALDGSPDQASAHALDAISKKWGVSGVNGGRLMPYPPERVYPQVNGSHDWLAKQLDDDVKAKAGDMGVPMFTPEGLEADSPTDAQETGRAKYAAPRALVSDAQTKADLDAGKSPSYRVIIQDGRGQFHALEQSPGVPFRFYGDPSADQAKAEADFTAAHQAQMRNPRLANPQPWLNP